ncbi:ATP-binding protein [Streptomyces cinereoruber]|uniref:ATP-binding protein n=1 Tax=Streptomyces cinereoruber TaxID=67260 RepID=UPI003635DCC6
MTGTLAGPVVACSTGHPAYSQTLPREARSAALARRLVRTALTVWGLEPLAGNATLVVSELVANAIDHGRHTSFRVIVSRPAVSGVRLGVVDRSRALPVLGTGADDRGRGRGRGRGLILVDALADEWGTEQYRWGKQVWAELRQGAPA